MNLLDENIRHDQDDFLRKWRTKSRRVGREIARPGIQDPDIIPLLHRLKKPTLASPLVIQIQRAITIETKMLSMISQ